MASSAADRSLLDRLNALKPSGVVLDSRQGHKDDALSTSHVTEATDAESRADALAARLRLLRQQSEPQDDRPGQRQVAPLPPTAPAVMPGVDPLLFSDERALNDFLSGLGEEEGDSDSDSDSDSDNDNGSFVLLPDVPQQLDRDEDDADDEKTVAHLLESLGGPGADGNQALSSSHRPDDPGDPDDSSGLHLPAVPTELVDRPERDATDDISERLAALRGLSSPDAGLGQTDAFGLPSAPTFCPGDDRPQPSSSTTRIGYTDEDRRSWCVVCLEDAAVRCLGCDNDPYCARCWREMHVGPAAGFDERGHKRVPFSSVGLP